MFSKAKNGFCHVQLRVASAASQSIEPGGIGIQCLGFPAEGGAPALVVVWDEGELNTGASVTNSIETVLRHLAETWETGVCDALVVERDSGGNFDHAVVEWPEPAQLLDRLPEPRINWTPIRWPGLEPRSKQAFVAMFGDRAKTALAFFES